jgi:hypothetical protein
MLLFIYSSCNALISHDLIAIIRSFSAVTNTSGLVKSESHTGTFCVKNFRL